MRPLTFISVMLGSLCGATIFDAYNVTYTEFPVPPSLMEISNQTLDGGITTLAIIFSTLTTLFFAIPILKFDWYRCCSYVRTLV